MRLFILGPESAGIMLAVPPSPLVERSRQVSRAELRDEGGQGGSAGFSPGRAKDTYVLSDCEIVQMSGEGIQGPSATRRAVVILEPGLKQDPVEVMKGIIELREKIPPSSAIMLADAEVWSFPLFALAGADLFGDSHATACAMRGEVLFESFSLPVGTVDPDACSCPSCKAEEGQRTIDVLGHNRWMTRKVLSEVRTAIRKGQLKHLAEERCTRQPELAAALRRLYREHLRYLERFTTVCPGVSG